MAILGALENAVMEILWAQGKPMRVREVHEVLSGDRELAYTTVMTVLDRLAKKQVLSRVPIGGERAWAYSPVSSRAELVATELAEVLSVAGSDRIAALRLLLAGLDPDDRAALGSDERSMLSSD